MCKQCKEYNRVRFLWRVPPCSAASAHTWLTCSIRVGEALAEGGNGAGGDSNGKVPRPFEGSYGVSLSTAVVASIPYIVITTAYELFRTKLGTDLHTDKQTLQIISSIATAGYAFGAMVGGDVIQSFKQRGLLLICEAFFVLGCLLAATAAFRCGRKIRRWKFGWPHHARIALQ